MAFLLKDFEKQYSILAKKYSLPKFRELNEEFEIDKIDRETFCLIRLIRKVMMEKIVNSLNFLEMLLNPVNTPRVYVPYIRAMSAEDRKDIEQVYTKLGELSIESLSLEVEYNEKQESVVVKNIYSTWQSIKPKLRNIILHMQRPIKENTSGVKKEKSYFG